MYPQVAMVLHHSPVACQRNLTSKVHRLDSVLPQVSGVSAHKKISLDSILPQVSGGLQDQARDGVAPQSSGMSGRSNVSSELKDQASDGSAPQSSGRLVSPQVSGRPQKQARDKIKQHSNRESNQCPNKTWAFPSELISIINEIRGQPIPAPMEQKFFFDMTQEAAAKNLLVFKR
jgi:hypothetical protein